MVEHKCNTPWPGCCAPGSSPQEQLLFNVVSFKVDLGSTIPFIDLSVLSVIY